MIQSIAFKNYRALRDTSVALGAFNVIIGANGSGKSSLMDAILRLRTLAGTPPEERQRPPDGDAEVTFRFTTPHDGIEARLLGRAGAETLSVSRLPDGGGDWEGLRRKLAGMRGFAFEQTALSGASPKGADGGLSRDGGNLAAVLAARRRDHPKAYAGLSDEFTRLLPEYAAVEVSEPPGGPAELRLLFKGDNTWISGREASQGTLQMLALLTLAHDPAPPPLVFVDEVDRGLHPRLLREARDALYRLAYPESAGRRGAASQVLVTTHSPYLLDLFREHPEEVLIAGKTGRTAAFTRLDKVPNLRELLGAESLGDLWYSGILGGVPEER